MLEHLLIAKSWHQKHQMQSNDGIPVDSNDSDDNEDSDTETNILDSEFLQQMVPQDCLSSDDGEESRSDTESDSDMDDELHTSVVQESVTMNDSSMRKRKRKEIPVIHTPLSGRLRKHVRRNYRV